MKTRAILLLSILLVTACQKSPTGGGDTEPPKVVQTFPENNASEVSVDTTLSFAFDEEIDPNSVSASINDSSAGSFGFSISSEKTKVTISLEESFDFSTEYTASITASDLMGNEMEEPYELNFTTEQDTTSPEEVDNTPPSVLSVYPEDGSTDVSVKSDIQTEISETIDNSTFHFEVEKVADGSKVSGSVTSEGNTHVFNPDNDLQYGTEYRVSIMASDTAGNEMEEPHLSNFETEAEPDTEAPIIQSVSPEDGAVDVSTTTDHRFEFNERVEEVSYSLEGDSETVDGEGEIDVDIFTFTPNESLKPSTTYTASITAFDLAGNEMEEHELSFTTEDQDNTPPEVTSTTPEDNATNVSPDTDVSASFSEHIDSDNSELTLSSNSGEDIEGSLSFDDNAISFAPSSSLSYSTTYTATVKGVDLNGNETSYSWSFTTADEPDNTPPEVISTTPEDEATNVSRDTDVEVTFSEEVDSENSELSLESNSGTSVTGNLSFSGDKISFDPSSSLSYSTTYTATVKGVDLNGNETSYSWSFTTADEPDNTPPTVVFTSPGNNETDVSTSVDMTEVGFSESVDASSISFSFLNESGNDVSGVSNVDDNIFTFDISDPLESDHTYELSIQASDLAGNEMTAYTWRFTTSFNPWETDKEQNGFSGVATGEDAVYVLDMFREGNGYYGFWLAEFSKEGKLNWIIDIPGKTDKWYDYGPFLTFNKDDGELYFFTEIDKVINFNKFDVQTKNLTSNPIPELNFADHSITYYKGNNYFYVGDGNFGSSLWKTDTNGNKLDELSFGTSGGGSVTAGNDTLFAEVTNGGIETIIKVDPETMEFGDVLTPSEGDIFPEQIASVDMNEDGNHIYIVGEYEDKPLLLISDVVTGESSSVEFGDVYDDVGYAQVDKNGNAYVLTYRPEGANLLKVSESGINWRVSISSESIVHRGLVVSDYLDMIFVPVLYNGTFEVYSSSGNLIYKD